MRPRFIVAGATWVLFVCISLPDGPLPATRSFGRGSSLRNAPPLRRTVELGTGRSRRICPRSRAPLTVPFRSTDTIRRAPHLLVGEATWKSNNRVPNGRGVLTAGRRPRRSNNNNSSIGLYLHRGESSAQNIFRTPVPTVSQFRNEEEEGRVHTGAGERGKQQGILLSHTSKCSESPLTSKSLQDEESEGESNMDAVLKRLKPIISQIRRGGRGRRKQEQLIASYGSLTGKIAVSGLCEQLSLEELADFFAMFRNVPAPPDERLLTSLFSHLRRNTRNLTSAQAGSILNSLAKMQARIDEDLVHELAERACAPVIANSESMGEGAEEGSCGHHSSSYHAQFGLASNPAEKNHATPTFKDAQPSVTASSAIHTLWSLAKLTAQPAPNLLSRLSAAIEYQSHAVDPVSSSMLLWSMARFAAASTRTSCLNPMPMAITEPSGRADGQSMENGSLNAKKFPPAHSELDLDERFGKVIDQLVQQHARTYPPHSVANVVWAYAKLGRRLEDETLVALLEQAKQMKDLLTPQGISNIFWGLARLLIQRDQDNQAFKSENAGNFDEADADWSVQNRRRPSRTKGRCAKGSPGLSVSVDWLWERARTEIGGFTPQGLANTLWAAAKLNTVVKPEFMDVVETRLQDLFIRLKPQEMANAVWGLATLSHKPNPTTLKRINSWVKRKGDELDSQELSNTLWALGKFWSQSSLEGPHPASPRNLRGAQEPEGSKAHSSETGLPMSPSSSKSSTSSPTSPSSPSSPLSTLSSTSTTASSSSSKASSSNRRAINALPAADSSPSQRVRSKTPSLTGSNHTHNVGHNAFRISQTTVDLLASQLRRVGRSLDTQELHNVYWGLAKLPFHVSAENVGILTARTQELIDEFSPKDIAGTLWSLGRIFDRSQATYDANNNHHHHHHLSHPHHQRQEQGQLHQQRHLQISTNRTSLIDTVLQQIHKDSVEAPGQVHYPLAGHNHEAVVGALQSRALSTLATFNSQDIANSMWGLARLATTPEPRFFQAIQDRAEELLLPNKALAQSHRVVAKRAVNVTANGTLETTTRDGGEEIAEKADLNGFSPSELAALFWAFGALETRPRPSTAVAMWQQLEVESMAGRLDAIGLVNILWAGARIQVPPGPLVLKRLAEKVPELTEQGVSNALWALAKQRGNESLGIGIGTGDTEDVEEAEEALPSKQEGKNPAASMLASENVDPRTISDNGKTGDAQTMEEGAEETQAREVLVAALLDQAVRISEEFTPQGLASVVWSMARLRCGPHYLEALLLQADVDTLSKLSPQGMSNVIWALARVKSRNRNIVDTVVRQTGRQISRLNAQELTILTWALARLRYSASHSILSSLESQAIDVIPKCTPQACTVLLWGFARMAHSPAPEFFRVYEEFCSKQAPYYNAQGISNTLWAMASLSIEPSPGLIEAFVPRAVLHLKRFSSDGLVQLFLSLARFGSSFDSRHHLQKLIRGTGECLEEGWFVGLNLKNLAAILLALARLKVSPQAQDKKKISGKAKEGTSGGDSSGTGTSTNASVSETAQPSEDHIKEVTFLAEKVQKRVLEVVQNGTHAQTLSFFDARTAPNIVWALATLKPPEAGKVAAMLVERLLAPGWPHYIGPGARAGREESYGQSSDSQQPQLHRQGQHTGSSSDTLRQPPPYPSNTRGGQSPHLRNPPSHQGGRHLSVHSNTNAYYSSAAETQPHFPPPTVLLGVKGVTKVLLSLAQLSATVNERSLRFLESTVSLHLDDLTCDQATDALWALSRLQAASDTLPPETRSAQEEISAQREMSGDKAHHQHRVQVDAELVGRLRQRVLTLFADDNDRCHVY